MKYIMIGAVLITMIAGALLMTQPASAQQGYVSFQLFYDELSPYGEWVVYPDYGYVWIPDVDQGFRPYGSGGHWVYTDDGWAWYSDYAWGWAPFHYGRWVYDDFYGWLWVPRNEWGPAWVTWRRSAGYYGWAPMAPGITIEVSFGNDYRMPSDRWIFVRHQDFGRPDIDRFYADRSTNVTIINNTTVINNTYVDNSRHVTYVAGPARDDVQKVTGKPVRPVAIKESAKPGQTLGNDQLQIYRPLVRASTTKDRTPAPAKLLNLKEVKPISARKRGDQNQPAAGSLQPSPPQQAAPAGQAPEKSQPRIGSQPQRDAKPATGPAKAKQSRKNAAPATVQPGRPQKSDQPQYVKPASNTGDAKQPKIDTLPGKKSKTRSAQPKTKQR
jgi:hypothetical protein